MTVAALGTIGGQTGLAHPTVPDLAGLPWRALTTFLIPALGEEAAFRGLLVVDRTETARPWASILFATLVFTAWHGMETLFLRHAAAIFLRPDFLVCAAVLGVGRGFIRWRTSSLWPSVALHWLVVIVWQTALDGPGIEALRRALGWRIYTPQRVRHPSVQSITPPVDTIAPYAALNHLYRNKLA